MNRFLILLLIGVFGVFLVQLAWFPHKETMESLVMPGSLSAAHARYENQCSQCHSSFKKENQNELCLNCHRDVKFDLTHEEGFHGRSRTAMEGQCKTCHTEHKGRSYSTINLEKETFNHNTTDFPLTGAHALLSVTCDSCHAQGKKLRDAPRDCFSCHARDDRHQGGLGQQCAQCHKETSWKETYFDHGRTKFPLTGKHQKVACEACHVSQNYKQTPVTCIACHLVNDVHGSPDQERCDRCHNAEGWKDIRYDHNKETKFVLKDKHAQVSCAGCHQQLDFKIKTASQCIDCHSIDDVHQGKNGSRCDQCHNSRDWKASTFDHNRDTKFKLSGRHAKIQCRDCHRDESKDMKIDAKCGSCHQADDVHKGQQGNECGRCHNDSGWREEIRFDHDLTKFPLIGIHAVTACGECHQSQAFKDTKMNCDSCHTKDDFHKQTLGTECSQCHNPNGWKLWEFDHDTQTQYRLEGGHAGLKCESCHQTPMNKKVLLDTNCMACHQEDDVHNGKFGDLCDRCHVVESFKSVILDK